MEEDVAAAWRFSLGLKEEWHRRYVLLEVLQREYGLSREQLVAAGSKERGYWRPGRKKSRTWNLSETSSRRAW